MGNNLADAVTHNASILLPLIVANGLSVLGAIAILIVGVWLAGRAHALLIKMLASVPYLDQMLIGFFGGMLRYFILTITVLAVLSQFGIQTTSLIAVLGAAGLAVGLALQGTLSNLAAGVMLLIFRPFRVGQSVQIGGILGNVKELTLFWTELVTDDKVQIIVPNGAVWGHPLRNFSFYPVRGFDVHFRVPETTNLEEVLAAVKSIVNNEPRIVRDPLPDVSLDRVGLDNYMEIFVKAWAAADSVGGVRTDIIKAVSAALQKNTPAD